MILFVLGYWCCRRVRLARRSLVNPGVRAQRADEEMTHSAVPPLPVAPTAGQLRTVAAWAFDYERLIIETTDAGGGQRDRALHTLSRLIVPLIGHVRLADVDDELVRSVRRVLTAQLEGVQAEYAGQLWTHFVGWSRYHAAPRARHSSSARFDVDVDRVYDDFDG